MGILSTYQQNDSINLAGKTMARMNALTAQSVITQGIIDDLKTKIKADVSNDLFFAEDLGQLVSSIQIIDSNAIQCADCKIFLTSLKDKLDDSMDRMEIDDFIDNN